MPRWHLSCDACDVAAWIGSADAGRSAWCEACQESAVLPAGEAEGVCRACGRPLTTGEPRFVEIFGELQNLAAVLAAWQGDFEPLRSLLPERPRFLSDRTPPASERGDPEAMREGLEALAHGDFAAAAARLEPGSEGVSEPRRLRGLAIALERRGDAAGAERALERVRGAGESTALLLERGTLRARRGDLARAREDFARAGDGFEARWNRAALEVHQAVPASGAPDAARLAAARREAGAPSSAWSDHTVGRLLWALLVERELKRGERDLAALRAAEREFEFDTFWDRAAVIEGYARLGEAADVARLAAPLVSELITRLTEQPAIAGDTALAAALKAGLAAVAEGRAGEARASVGSLLGRPDLPRYRVPCRRCGRGSVGVDECAEDDADAREIDGNEATGSPVQDSFSAPRGSV